MPYIIGFFIYKLYRFLNMSGAGSMNIHMAYLF